MSCADIRIVAGEIENLRNEAQALQEIRNSMGSDDFTQNVFNKVFTDDIVRLRDMEDAWKSRAPPEPLSFSSLDDESKNVPGNIVQDDQKVWSLAEDLAAFKDRYVDCGYHCQRHLVVP